MSTGDNSNEFPPGEGGSATGNGGGVEPPLNTGRPAVAAAPGKLVFVIIFAGIFIFIIVRSLFFGEKAEVKPPAAKHKGTVIADNSKSNQSEFTPGALPAPPPVDITVPAPPAPTPPPPPPPALTAPIAPDIHASGPTSEALSKRIHSSMIASGGSGKSLSSLTPHHRAAVPASNDPNSAFAQAISETDAQSVEARKIQNLNVTIAQGKLIHAVLESAIDSDLPGPIRAIVSHDTYAEAGRDIMIPKGSRIIGTYNAQVRRGQTRVFIIWQRVIRPDGIDVMIDSPGIDTLGRAGMGGDVDNKYFEMFSSAILTSAMDVGVAAVGDALFGNQQSTTTNNGTGSTTTESPTAAAMQQAVSNIGQVGTNIVSGALNLSPTIYVDQGTPIEIFVNRDLIFPTEITGHTGFVQ